MNKSVLQHIILLSVLVLTSYSTIKCAQPFQIQTKGPRIRVRLMYADGRYKGSPEGIFLTPARSPSLSLHLIPQYVWIKRDPKKFPKAYWYQYEYAPEVTSVNITALPYRAGIALIEERIAGQPLRRSAVLPRPGATSLGFEVRPEIRIAEPLRPIRREVVLPIPAEEVEKVEIVMPPTVEETKKQGLIALHPRELIQNEKVKMENFLKDPNIPDDLKNQVKTLWERIDQQQGEDEYMQLVKHILKYEIMEKMQDYTEAQRNTTVHLLTDEKIGLAANADNPIEELERQLQMLPPLRPRRAMAVPAAPSLIRRYFPTEEPPEEPKIKFRTFSRKHFEFLEKSLKPVNTLWERIALQPGEDSKKYELKFKIMEKMEVYNEAQWEIALLLTDQMIALAVKADHPSETLELMLNLLLKTTPAERKTILKLNEAELQERLKQEKREL